jgi:SIR2-like domain
MADFRIPDDLAQLLTQRRIIPFIGAGFSAVHSVPTWEDLLRSLAEEIQTTADIQPVLSFDEIAEACGNDNLQIAEYLYLIAGESIGPLRHGLSTALQSKTPLLESTPHVELANLGAPHVYTTNFDDLIEKTYRELELPVDVISVPRDMTLSHADRTEIVKYHGDLRHEKTLVLTESQYYTRLEFESPMDLKFRSDLLGRSVLFMGYSFRDINIRVIWFRLMQMMKDVPLKDRPASYIVRLWANPVLDSLYGAVGLRTLVIDPSESATTPDAQNELLSEFLMELSLRCSGDGKIPGSERQAFLSLGLVEQVEKQLEGAITQGSAPRARIVRMPDGKLVRRTPPANGDIVATTPLLAALDRLMMRYVTEPAAARVSDLLLRLAQTVDTVGSRPTLASELAGWFTWQRGASIGATLLVARSLLRQSPREALLDSSRIDWGAVWKSQLNPSDFEGLLSTIQAEIEGHEEGDYEDDDVAYGIDLLRRILDGGLITGEDDEEIARVRDRADELMSRSAAIYPAAESYEPPADEYPDPIEIRREIEAKVAEEEPEDEDD